MKFIFEGNAKSKPEAIGILTEDLLLDKTAANVKLSKYKIVDRIIYFIYFSNKFCWTLLFAKSRFKLK